MSLHGQPLNTWPAFDVQMQFIVILTQFHLYRSSTGKAWILHFVLHILLAHSSISSMYEQYQILYLLCSSSIYSAKTKLIYIVISISMLNALSEFSWQNLHFGLFPCTESFSKASEILEYSFWTFLGYNFCSFWSVTNS